MQKNTQTNNSFVSNSYFAHYVTFLDLFYVWGKTVLYNDASMKQNKTKQKLKKTPTPNLTHLTADVSQLQLPRASPSSQPTRYPAGCGRQFTGKA